MPGDVDALARLAEMLSVTVGSPVTADMVEGAVELAVVAVVDLMVGDPTPLDAALRAYLALPPPSGVHGQSMDATNAFRTVCDLRAAAARHLAAAEVPDAGA